MEQNCQHPVEIAWIAHRSFQGHEESLERGKGVFVYDSNGKAYIEGMAGLWCTALGYGIGHGGAEVWIWKKIAIYADLGVIQVRGAANTGGEARMDDSIHYIFTGAKFSLTAK